MMERWYEESNHPPCKPTVWQYLQLIRLRLLLDGLLDGLSDRTVASVASDLEKAREVTERLIYGEGGPTP